MANQACPRLAWIPRFAKGRKSGFQGYWLKFTDASKDFPLPVQMFFVFILVTLAIMSQKSMITPCRISMRKINCRECFP
jgi:hypothetical protein